MNTHIVIDKNGKVYVYSNIAQNIKVTYENNLSAFELMDMSFEIKEKGLNKVYDWRYVNPSCSTCKYNRKNIPHTCDICTSLDTEEYYMYEPSE